MRTEQNSQEAHKRRTRRALALCGAMLLFAAGTLGTLAFRSAQARNGAYGHIEPDRPWEDPAREKVLLAQRINGAKKLRQSYRSWALAHRDVLSAMLNAKSGDTGALMAAWNAFPADPTRRGAARA